jgi:hypothetical protein
MMYHCMDACEKNAKYTLHCYILPIGNNHRYLSKVGILVCQKSTSTRASANSGHKTRKAGWQGRWGNNMANIFAPILATKIQTKTRDQGILKGEVSLYCCPPVWLVWYRLFDNWQLLFLFAKQTNPNQSNRRSTVQWYFPF